MEWRKAEARSTLKGARVRCGKVSATAVAAVHRLREEFRSMKPYDFRIADFWCRLMHTEPMWTSHGYYECRLCGRRRRVCWEGPLPALLSAKASRRETSSRGALPTAAESRVQC